MGILVSEETRVLIIGISGRIGEYHCKRMLDYGTRVVGGVSPGKGGNIVHGVSVFNTIKEAIRQTNACTTLMMVPPPFAADSIMEAADAGISLCVAITDGIPAQDMIKVKRYMRRYRKEQRMRLLGPNCAGIITPGTTMVGVMPENIYQQGSIGIVSRSGTLGYEAAAQLADAGLGVSTSVGIGGDQITGSSYLDMLKLFDNDEETKAVVLLGEIGGPQEAEAADYIHDNFSKPVIAYIAGASAPPGRSLGHAGAIITAFGERADEKANRLRDVGAIIAEDPSQIGSTVKHVVGSKP